ncbi:MAG: GNAT family N-acetyltransferase [Nanoarchaeota archaeon]
MNFLEKYTIRSLSKSQIKEAVALYHRVFGNKQNYSGAIWIPASVYKKEYEEIYKEGRTKSVDAWAVCDKKRIIAVTGLFVQEDEPDTTWISWFFVHPEYRRQGIGSALLKWTIAEARRRRKKYLKVYSSDHPRERASAYLYEKYGFAITKKTPEPNTKYTLIFRRLKL